MKTGPSEIKIRTHPISLLEGPERIRSAHRGEIIHRALSFLGHFTGRGDIERAVLQALSLQGGDQRRWKLDEEFLDPLLNALSLPQVKPWFARGGENLREVEVVDARGELHRIDRVVIRGETIDVIDYKVGHREEGHQVQVALYRGLVEAIFRRPAGGYLLYIDEPAVVAVP